MSQRRRNELLRKGKNRGRELGWAIPRVLLRRFGIDLQSQTFVLFTDAAVIFSLRLAAAVIAYVTQILLARWMGAAELGLYISALSWFWILASISMLGQPSASRRFIPQYLAAGNKACVKGFILFARRSSVACGLFLGVASTVVVLVFEGRGWIEDATTWIIAFFAIPIFALIALNTAFARAQLWFLFASLSDTFARPLLVLLGVLMLFLAGTSITAVKVMLVLVTVLITVAIGQTFVLSRRLDRELGPVRPDFQARTWIRIGLPLLLIEGFIAYYADINIIVVQTLLPPEEIAVYNAALRTVGIIAFGLNAVNAIVAPRASRLAGIGDQIALQRLVARATQLMFWPALCATLVTVFLGKKILALFGEAFVAGYDALVILALAQLLIGAAGPGLTLLNITGHQDRCLRIFACALVATVGLNILLVPRYGIAGGATAVLIVTLAWVTWVSLLVVKHLGIQPSIFSFRWIFR